MLKLNKTRYYSSLVPHFWFRRKTWGSQGKDVIMQLLQKLAWFVLGLSSRTLWSAGCWMNHLNWPACTIWSLLVWFEGLLESQQLVYHRCFWEMFEPVGFISYETKFTTIKSTVEAFGPGFRLPLWGRTLKASSNFCEETDATAKTVIFEICNL